MMDYINFVHIHELYRFSFKDLCENSQVSDGQDQPPSVCFIAIKGPNVDQVLNKFNESI